MTFKQALRQARTVYISLTPARSSPITLPVAKFTIEALIEEGYDATASEDHDVATWELDGDTLTVWFQT